MESVKKAKNRLKNYPLLLAKCAESAAVYASCVTRDLNVKQHICDKEFREFNKCLQQAAKDLKTKL